MVMHIKVLLNLIAEIGLSFDIVLPTKKLKGVFTRSSNHKVLTC